MATAARARLWQVRTSSRRVSEQQFTPDKPLTEHVADDWRAYGFVANRSSSLDPRSVRSTIADGREDVRPPVT